MAQQIMDNITKERLIGGILILIASILVIFLIFIFGVAFIELGFIIAYSGALVDIFIKKRNILWLQKILSYIVIGGAVIVVMFFLKQLSEASGEISLYYAFFSLFPNGWYPNSIDITSVLPETEIDKLSLTAYFFRFLFEFFAPPIAVFGVFFWKSSKPVTSTKQKKPVIKKTRIYK